MLFITYHVDTDPYKAMGELVNVNGNVIDSFTILASANPPATTTSSTTTTTLFSHTTTLAPVTTTTTQSPSTSNTTATTTLPSTTTTTTTTTLPPMLSDFVTQMGEVLPDLATATSKAKRTAKTLARFERRARKKIQKGITAAGQQRSRGRSRSR